MRVIKKIKEMQSSSDDIRSSGKIIGFVPTMGFLHEAHLSLFRIARKKCDLLVVSIFVNPTQFGPEEDFEQYPRDFERDEKLCSQENVDILFYPESTEMYPEPNLTSINVKRITEKMCGISRPGHFQGVSSVVGKLFNIVKPHFAVFGQKDYQQALVIKQMVKDLNFNIEVITAPIIREQDGLALSSRNKYLSERERKYALVLYQSLQHASKLVKDETDSPAVIKMQMEEIIRRVPNVTIDYISIADADTLEEIKIIKNRTLIAVAIFIGKVRLIDNIVINADEKFL